jgi:hypothetical protein
VTDGLVLYLDAANPKSYPGSGVTWSNITTSSNNGSLTNGASFNSINGGSIFFDGTNDYVEFGNATFGGFATATFSYSAWFYFSGSSQFGFILGKRQTGGFQQWQMGIMNDATFGGNGTNLTTYLRPDDTSPDCAFNYQLNNAGWYHGTITVGTSEQKMYVNGANVVTFTRNYSTDSFLIPNGRFYIGAVNNGSTDGNKPTPAFFFKSSYIPVVQLYNKTLTASEVLQNFNALRGRFGI